MNFFLVLGLNFGCMGKFQTKIEVYVFQNVQNLLASVNFTLKTGDLPYMCSVSGTWLPRNTVILARIAGFAFYC